MKFTFGMIIIIVLSYAIYRIVCILLEFKPTIIMKENNKDEIMNILRICYMLLDVRRKLFILDLETKRILFKLRRIKRQMIPNEPIVIAYVYTGIHIKSNLIINLFKIKDKKDLSNKNHIVIDIRQLYSLIMYMIEQYNQQYTETEFILPLSKEDVIDLHKTIYENITIHHIEVINFISGKEIKGCNFYYIDDIFDIIKKDIKYWPLYEQKLLIYFDVFGYLTRYFDVI